MANKSFKSTKVAGIIFAVLLFFAISHYIVNRKKFVKPVSSIENISSFRIEDGNRNERAELIKDGDKWVVKNSTGFVADSQKVKNFLEAVEEIKLEALISENPEEFYEYGVSTTNAYGIFLDGKNLYIGKNAGDFLHFYVAFDDCLWLASGERFILTRSIDFYKKQDGS